MSERTELGQWPPLPLQQCLPPSVYTSPERTVLREGPCAGPPPPKHPTPVGPQPNPFFHPTTPKSCSTYDPPSVRALRHPRTSFSHQSLPAVLLHSAPPLPPCPPLYSCTAPLLFCCPRIPPGSPAPCCIPLPALPCPDAHYPSVAIRQPQQLLCATCSPKRIWRRDCGGACCGACCCGCCCG